MRTKEEENLMHLEQLEELVKNFDKDEVRVVARVLAENYFDVMLESVSARMSKMKKTVDSLNGICSIYKGGIDED